MTLHCNSECTHHNIPLSDEQIDQLALDTQVWFAARLGSAPAYWTNEQVRTCKEFRAAITAIVRAAEHAHNIRIVKQNEH